MNNLDKSSNYQIKSDKRTLFQEFISLLNVILLALVIRVFIFEPYYIPSESMRSNFIEGDYVFSTKYNYGYSKYSLMFNLSFLNKIEGRVFAKQPERGDVIIFRPPNNMDIRYIKRLIAMPGEKVEVKNGVIYVNDKEFSKKPIKEFVHDNKNFYQFEETNMEGRKYLVQYYTEETIDNLHPYSYELHYKANNFGPIIVPEGKYFFIGDNRDQSADSRFDLGTVPFENFISKVAFIFFSFEQTLFKDNIGFINQLKRFGTWIFSFRTDRLFKKFDN